MAIIDRIDMKLSIIVPTLNEESNLPLLIADINKWQKRTEIIVVDCGSSDNTLLIATLANAKILHAQHPNRGLQMDLGADISTGEWLLFLHADSRLSENWVEKVSKVVNNSSSRNTAWFFNLKVDKRSLFLRIMEIFVYFRSKYLKRPYGDQGLLVHNQLYKKIGGFKPMFLMEDIDIVERIGRNNDIKSLGTFIITNGRKWERSNAIKQSIKNAFLRWKWKEGDSTYSLYKKYYKK